MLKRNIFLIGSMLVMVFSGCNGRDKQLNQIEAQSTALDSIMRAHPVLSIEEKANAEELVESYMAFIRDYPNDSLCPAFLLKAAMIYNHVPAYKKSIEVTDRLIAEYPDAPEVEQAVAMGARTAEDFLKDYDKARAYLTIIQEKFAEGPYGVNVDLQIEYVGDPEGLFRAIRERAGIATDTVETASVDAVK